MVNVLIKPFYIFGIDRSVQNLVGLETYGHYSILLSFTYLMQIINDFGIQNFNSRNISQHSHLIEKYFPNILILKGILALFCIAITFAIAWILGWKDDKMLLFLTFNQILTSLIFFFRSNISGLAMYRMDSFISILDKVLMIFGGILLIWILPSKNNFQIIWFVYLQTAALLLTALVAFFIVFKRLRWFHFRFNPLMLWYLLRASFPFAMVIFLMTFYTRIDMVMMKQLLPDGEIQAGVYASAYRLLDAVNMIGYLFATLLLPMFARLLAKKESIHQLIQLSAQLILSISVGVAVMVWFFRLPVMELLYDHAAGYSADVLGFLMLSFVAVSGTYIYGTLLTANGSLKAMNKLFVIGILINIILNIILIPHFKAIGTAIATCITQFFVMATQVWLSTRLTSLRIDFTMLGRLSLYAILSIISIFLIQNLQQDWKILFAFGTCVIIALSMLCGLVNPWAALRVFRKG